MAFRDAYRQKFHEEPIDYAAYAYDGMNILIAAIEKTGLNRGRIMDVLRDYQMKTYQGVAGHGSTLTTRSTTSRPSTWRA